MMKIFAATAITALICAPTALADPAGSDPDLFIYLLHKLGYYPTAGMAESVFDMVELGAGNQACELFETGKTADQVARSQVIQQPGGLDQIDAVVIAASIALCPQFKGRV
jgi:Protein of unknown function (DUF732)